MKKIIAQRKEHEVVRAWPYREVTSGLAPGQTSQTGHDLALWPEGRFLPSKQSYILLPGDGCEVVLRYTPGPAVPPGTRIGFIQAVATRFLDNGQISEAGNGYIGRQPTAGDFSRIDQFPSVPSPFYEDGFEKEEMGKLVKWSHEDPDMKQWAYYQQAMPGTELTEPEFNRFWHHCDQHELNQYLTPQTSTPLPGLAMQVGEKNTDECPGEHRLLAGIKRLLTGPDKEAVLYDHPSRNLSRFPHAANQESESRFHTAALSKTYSGDTTVWGVIEWGYRIRKENGKRCWHPILPQEINLEDSMVPAALAAMKARWKADYTGPDRLTEPQRAPRPGKQS